ncbi:MAG TPA: hypothetical protein VGL94_19925 [Ktedonobacteraceae bacterium]|jgi:hypothetical protein
MDDRLLQKFLSEIARQCRFCLIAYEDLTTALKTNTDRDRLWYSVQSFLIASGNISKLLFGSRQSYSQRADLRNILGIDDTSIFHFSNRQARNYFEHFDEQLEEWFTSSTRHNFVDSNIGPLSVISGMEPHNFIRNIDPAKMAITFYGDECLILPIVKAVEELKESVKVEAEKHWWHLPIE